VNAQSENPMLVCLDLTEIDATLIRYGRYLASLLPGARLMFLHTIQYYDIDLEGVQDEEEKRRVIEESVREELLEKLRSYIPDLPAENLLIREAHEDAALTVIELAKELSVRFILVGEKEGRERSKWYSRRITREGPAHTLIIPETEGNTPADSTADGEPRFGRVFYAGDFSQSTDAGLRFADRLAGAAGAELCTQYVRDVTSDYYPTGRRPDAGTEKKQLREVQQAFQRLGISGEEVDQRFYWEREQYESEAQRLYEAAVAREADLIVIAAAGRSEGVTTLIGNLIVTMSKIDKTIPILFYDLQSEG
jgi:nucleotide-binding universal stress UspA family protein